LVVVAVFLTGLLAGLSPGRVADAKTTSFWFPVDGWTTYDDCAEEPVDWSGKMHFAVRTTTDGNCTTYHTHFNQASFHGVGRVSGTKYVDASATKSANTYCGWGQAWKNDWHERRHIVRQGSGVDYALRLDLYMEYAPPPDNIWISEIKRVEFWSPCE
jgi:hypothetical protein